MCSFRWCGRQLCLRNMPISGVNSTPRPTAVYASDPASPRRLQDSLPSRLLAFERTRLALASSFQLSSRTSGSSAIAGFRPHRSHRAALPQWALQKGPEAGRSSGRLVHTREVRLQGLLALCPALRLPRRDPFLPLPFLHRLVSFGDFIDSMERSDSHPRCGELWLSLVRRPRRRPPVDADGSHRFRNGRLANRRRIGRVVLVAPNPRVEPGAGSRLHVRGRDQLDLEAEPQQLPPPVMRRRAGLHRYDARRELGEELRQRAAPQLAGNDDLALRVDAVDLERVLRQIEPDPRDRRQFSDRLAHGRLPFRWVDDNDHLGTLMPFGAPSTPSFRLRLASDRAAGVLLTGRRTREWNARSTRAGQPRYGPRLFIPQSGRGGSLRAESQSSASSKPLRRRSAEHA